MATATTGGQEPNLGDVPSQAPETSSQAARQQAREGLMADRSQARYSDETLTGEGLVGTAPGLTDPSAPAAATRTAPSAPPFASVDGQSGTQQPAARQSYQLGGSQAAAQTAAPAATQAQASAQTATQTATQAQQTQTSRQAAPAAALPRASQTQSQTQPQSAQPPRAAQAAPQQAQQQAVAVPSPPPTPSLPPLPPGPPVLLGVIYFNHNSTALSQRDLQVLRQVVALQQQSGGVLRVVGHASQRTAQLNPQAHEQTNLQLSQRRAESVARALRGFGVRPDAVIAEGRGDTEQLYYEFMPTGEAGNRRVEIFLQS